jgi:hypothetical protein
MTLYLYDARHRGFTPSSKPFREELGSVQSAWEIVLAAEEIPDNHGYPSHIDHTVLNRELDPGEEPFTLNDDIQTFNDFWSIYGWTIQDEGPCLPTSNST